MITCFSGILGFWGILLLLVLRNFPARIPGILRDSWRIPRILRDSCQGFCYELTTCFSAEYQGFCRDSENTRDSLQESSLRIRSWTWFSYAKDETARSRFSFLNTNKWLFLWQITFVQSSRLVKWLFLWQITFVQSWRLVKWLFLWQITFVQSW